MWQITKTCHNSQKLFRETSFLHDLQMETVGSKQGARVSVSLRFAAGVKKVKPHQGAQTFPSATCLLD